MLKHYVWNIPGLSLLIPSKSGILYANQTGGYATLDQEIEGWLLSLFDPAVDQVTLLNRHFTGPSWKGYCSEGITIDTAEFLDGILQMSVYTSWLRVDRLRIHDSHEAWIHVVAHRLHDFETVEFNGFSFSSGILTWKNGD